MKQVLAVLLLLWPSGMALGEVPDHELLAHLGRDLDSAINPNLVLPTSDHGLLAEADKGMLRLGVQRCKSYYKAQKYLNAAQFCFAVARHHGAIGPEEQSEVVLLLADLVGRGLGTGDKPQPESRVRLLRFAAELGSVEAMYDYALAHYRGKGAARNYRVASQWFGYAAERGDARSQLVLGELLSGGLAVGQDFEQAYFWYSLAARGGNADAQGKREAAARLLLPMQLTQVERRLRNWSPQPAGPLDADD